jgi:hypothetical protein
MGTARAAFPVRYAHITFIANSARTAKAQKKKKKLADSPA